MTHLMRFGAISSTVWMPLASTAACRVSGFVTAGKSCIRFVCAAAWPRMTNVSRPIIWLSRMPAPSKPAASMRWKSPISSGSGAVPGTRMWTRTGSVITLLLVRRTTHRRREERRGYYRFAVARPECVAVAAARRAVSVASCEPCSGAAALWLSSRGARDSATWRSRSIRSIHLAQRYPLRGSPTAAACGTRRASSTRSDMVYQPLPCR